MNEEDSAGPLVASLSPENGFMSLKEPLDQSLNSEIEKSEELEEKREESSEISDNPNVSGTSLLVPDPSLGCFPVGFHSSFKPTGKSSCATLPEEDPGTKAWNYLLRLNIVELLEIATAEIFHRRMPDPIDFLIEATAEAKIKWQEKMLEKAKLKHAEEEAARIAYAILRAIGDDPSTHGYTDEVDVLPRDSFSSVITPSSSIDVDRMSCFPEPDTTGFDLQALERHLSPAEAGARAGGVCGRPPNKVTSEEALKMLSYLL